MNAISIQRLTKSYGRSLAVDDVTLDVPQGTVFGLLGPNGAGKSTTFKCMLGLARTSSGTVAFDGRPLSPASLERIAFVPERSVLYDWMSVAEHVEMQRRAYAKFDVKRAFELLETLGVTESRKKARTLSKGMRTATAIALAFARTPEILVLDEPTSGLDPINQRAVLNLIVNAAAGGSTIVFSSHQIGQVERAAECIAILQRGRIVLKGDVDDLKSDRKIVEGILPSEQTSVNGLASDARVSRVDRNGRILRATVVAGADGIADVLTAHGAQGVRVVDLNLEDIFLNAVTPGAPRADVVVGA